MRHGEERRKKNTQIRDLGCQIHVRCKEMRETKTEKVFQTIASACPEIHSVLLFWSDFERLQSYFFPRREKQMCKHSGRMQFLLLQLDSNVLVLIKTYRVTLMVV
jgi:hypothetical protein